MKIRIVSNKKYDQKFVHIKEKISKIEEAAKTKCIYCKEYFLDIEHALYCSKTCERLQAKDDYILKIRLFLSDEFGVYLCNLCLRHHENLGNIYIPNKVLCSNCTYELSVKKEAKKASEREKREEIIRLKLKLSNCFTFRQTTGFILFAALLGSFIGILIYNARLQHLERNEKEKTHILH